MEGLVVDFDAAGDVVGFDIDHASHKVDLSVVETIALPAATAAEGRVIMKDENDFSTAERGKFYRPDAALAPPRVEKRVIGEITLQSTESGITT